MNEAPYGADPVLRRIGALSPEAGVGRRAGRDPETRLHAAEPGPPDAEDLRSRALRSAVTAYAAAHGHPLDHGGAGPAGGPRWRTPVRAGTVAVLVLTVLAAAVVARSLVVPEVVTTHLGERPAIAEPAPGDGGATAGASPVPAADGAAGADAPVSAEASAEQADGTVSDAPVVVVHVVGEVERPGLVTLSAGARVADAIDAAGGPRPDADLARVNLARLVVDGEQLYLPRPGEEPPAAAHDSTTGAGAGAVGGGLVDLNAADGALLETLPGIGPVLAGRIVEHRQARPFTSVDQLVEVTGIGPALLGGLRDQVTV